MSNTVIGFCIGFSITLVTITIPLIVVYWKRIAELEFTISVLRKDLIRYQTYVKINNPNF